MPCRTSRLRVLPNPAENRNVAMRSAMRSFSSRVHTLTLMRFCARSIASAWLKCTTYTGACRVESSSSRDSCTGVST